MQNENIGQFTTWNDKNRFETGFGRRRILSVNTNFTSNFPTNSIFVASDNECIYIFICMYPPRVLHLTRSVASEKFCDFDN